MPQRGGVQRAGACQSPQAHPPHVGPEAQIAIGQTETGEARRDGTGSLNGGRGE